MSADNVEKIVEEAVPLMIMIFLGWFLAHFRREYFPPEMVNSFNRLIFNVSIPCLVFKGLATRHLPDLNWEFVGVFLLLRVFFGVLTLGCTLLPLFRQRKIDFTADFLTNYIGTTWINTIIFGAPLLQSLYGKPVQILNILASFSSFIFQLPIMLILFELREARRRPLQDSPDTKDSDCPKPKALLTKDATNDALPTHLEWQHHVPVEDHASTPAVHVTIFPADGTEPHAEGTVAKDSKPQREIDMVANQTSNDALGKEQIKPSVRATGAVHHRVVLGVLLKVLRNPPFVGICLGLLWSFIIRWGNDDKTWPVYIDKWVQYFSDVVTPLAAFSVGMFMDNRLKSVIVHWRQNLLLIFSKMVLLPALTIPLCLMLGVDGIEGRSAVLIASLPVAVASFALGHNYMLQERWPVEILASQIVLGTILMPLVFIAWHAFMESVSLFGDIPANAVYKPK